MHQPHELDRSERSQLQSESITHEPLTNQLVLTCRELVSCREIDCMDIAMEHTHRHRVQGTGNRQERRSQEGRANGKRGDTNQPGGKPENNARCAQSMRPRVTKITSRTRLFLVTCPLKLCRALLIFGSCLPEPTR